MIVLHKIKDAEMLLENGRAYIQINQYFQLSSCKQISLPVKSMLNLPMLRLAVDNLPSLLAHGKDWRKQGQLYQEGLRKSIIAVICATSDGKVNLMLGLLQMV